MKRLTFLLAAFLLCASAQAAAPLAKIQSMLVKPALMCGRFDQTKQLTGLKRPLPSNGRFCVVTGKGVLWRTLKPFPNTLRLTKDEIVIRQGDRLTMRLDSKTEPAVKIINTVLFSLLSGEMSKLDTFFDVDGSIDGASWKVALKAKQPALAKAIGDITLEGGTYVKTIHIDEANGDRTAIVFSEIKTGEGAITPDEAALF